VDQEKGSLPKVEVRAGLVVLGSYWRRRERKMCRVVCVGDGSVAFALALLKFLFGGLPGGAGPGRILPEAAE